MKQKQLYKSSTNKQLAGVCGGIGEYFGIDPTIVRLLFAVVAIIGVSSGFWLYVLLAIILPYDYQVDALNQSKKKNPFNFNQSRSEQNTKRKDVTPNQDDNDDAWSDF